MAGGRRRLRVDGDETGGISMYDSEATQIVQYHLKSRGSRVYARGLARSNWKWFYETFCMILMADEMMEIPVIERRNQPEFPCILLNSGRWVKRRRSVRQSTQSKHWLSERLQHSSGLSLSINQRASDWTEADIIFLFILDRSGIMWKWSSVLLGNLKDDWGAKKWLKHSFQ